MRHFPVFMKVEGRRILVSGGGETAVAKLRLLLKTQAKIAVYSPAPVSLVNYWAENGMLRLVKRELMPDDVPGATLVYAANDEENLDADIADMARNAGVPVNIVDNLEESDFLTPAIVDRDPVTVAIGTEGTAPVLARKIKADIEASLPASIGKLARIGNDFRSRAALLPSGLARRKFWSRFFYKIGPAAIKHGDTRAVEQSLEHLLKEVEQEPIEPGKVFFVGAGPGDPDLLTRRASNLIHEADVVIHDRLVAPEILELARREATIVETGKKGFGPSWKQEDINDLMIQHAGSGHRVVRLKSGDPTVFGRLDEEMDALDGAAIEFEIIPGITTASAAAASLNVSLTKRRRNSALQVMTSHDIKGFAEHDWQQLIKPGAVAAIYMGLRQAHFLSGRLLMHGASPDIPVTILQNVSRAGQKIYPSTVATLAKDAASVPDVGPVILMLGLEPRKAAQEIVKLPQAQAPHVQLKEIG